LEELCPFDPEQKIIEYQLSNADDEKLISLSAKDLATETASESMAPGGGSIAAYVGALGVSLGTMVANLSANKAGWESKLDVFSNWAVEGQELKKEMLFLVDEDTRSFNGIIDAIRMAKDTDAEKAARKNAIELASQYAAEVPYKVMQTAMGARELLQAMLEIGNPASVTDAGVGALCCLTAIEGAYMNVRINTKDLSDHTFANDLNAKAENLLKEAKQVFGSITTEVHQKIS
ncbi:MAG: cyclodeaminase/cyclohydrolase family protein, partial [Bacteroidia bacterium]